MHIPDGFVDIPTAVATGVVSLGVVAYSLRKTGKDLGERAIPLLGVTAAFIFAAQMLNFPVGGGTSGHFLGAMLAVALMGPWAAATVVTVVLVVQALAMADGGITALGANVLNMGGVAVFAGFGFFALSKKLLPRTLTGYLVAVAVASWISIVLASAAASLELAVSDTVPLGVALPAMVSVHMVIGLGEALITVAVVGAVLAARPDLVRSFDLSDGALRGASGAADPPGTANAPGPRAASQPGALTGRRVRLWAFVSAALVLAASLAVFVSPFASGSPDGLERVAADQGFAAKAAELPVWNFFPFGDYQMPGIGNEKVATAMAGLVGTLLLFALILLAGRAFGRRRVVTEPETVSVQKPSRSDAWTSDGP
jgi:cobalt/nickel transport system permease protein